MKKVRMLVLGENASGAPDVMTLEVELPEDGFQLGEHYDLAAEAASTVDFSPKLTIDQYEVPREMLLKALDWISAGTQGDVDFTGQRVKIMFDMTDSEPDGGERETPAGSIGTVDCRTGVDSWTVSFDNGASGFFSAQDLLDEKQCRLEPAPGAFDAESDESTDVPSAPKF